METLVKPRSGNCGGVQLTGALPTRITNGRHVYTFPGKVHFRKTLCWKTLDVQPSSSGEPPSPLCRCRTFQDCTKRQHRNDPVLALNRHGPGCDPGGTFRLRSGPVRWPEVNPPYRKLAGKRVAARFCQDRAPAPPPANEGGSFKPLCLLSSAPALKHRPPWRRRLSGGFVGPSANIGTQPVAG